VNELYNEKYKTLKKEIEENTRRLNNLVTKLCNGDCPKREGPVERGGRK
jgi:hypothetical protein